MEKSSRSYSNPILASLFWLSTKARDISTFLAEWPWFENQIYQSFAAVSQAD